MIYCMSQSVTFAAKETPNPAMRYLLAYLEEGRVCVYAPRLPDQWSVQRLPEEEELRVEAQLHELHRTNERTAVVEIRLFGHEETRSVRVLCVRT